MSKKNSNYSQKLPTVKQTILGLLIIVMGLIGAFPKLYEIKAKAGIDISKSRHASTFFNKHTRGLFKCEWLYPYRSCNNRRQT